MLFRHIYFNTMVLREWRGEAFPDDEGRTDTGSANLENRILYVVTGVIVTGHLPILYNILCGQNTVIFVIVTGHLPILYDSFSLKPPILISYSHQPSSDTV